MRTVADALRRLEKLRLVAVLRVDRAEQVAPAVEALVAGGVGAVELTFTTPGVERELERARAEHPQLLLGAGTIGDPAEAGAAASAGADFLVTPHLDPALLRACLDTGRLTLPGVLTPSELAAALRAGAEAVKLFPAGSVGVGHLVALFGPFPGVRVLPTGGIGLDDVGGWLDAGAFAVGVGGALCSPSLIAGRRFEELRERAQRFSLATGGRGVPA
jgi:2-dehydro-3-deoxyphosphogluconate aldolase/(4S)-4-hydroxy-2-oxoglutarate aldolase